MLVIADGGAPTLVDYLFRVADRPDESRPVLAGIGDFLTGQDVAPQKTAPLVPGDDSQRDGMVLLLSADAAMNGLDSLHECNNINGVVTLLDYSAPATMRYAIENGGMSIIDGSIQWHSRGAAGWTSQSRPSPFKFPDFTYADGASGIRLEGPVELGGQPHTLVSFYSPVDDSDYWFWVDDRTRRISRLVMNVPPTHYMVSTFHEFDDVGRIPLPTEEGDTSELVPAVSEEVACRRHLP